VADFEFYRAYRLSPIGTVSRQTCTCHVTLTNFARAHLTSVVAEVCSFRYGKDYGLVMSAGGKKGVGGLQFRRQHSY